MFFTITNSVANYRFTPSIIKHDAWTVINLYSIKSSEQKLNQYLLNEYKLNLKQASLFILRHSKILQDKAGNVTVLFTDRKIDKLASLITYGNGKISGSNILVIAFGSRRDG